MYSINYAKHVTRLTTWACIIIKLILFIYSCIYIISFQVAKEKANIQEKVLTVKDIEAINDNISKSGGDAKLNPNCTLISVDDAEILHIFLKCTEDQGPRRNSRESESSAISGCHGYKRRQTTPEMGVSQLGNATVEGLSMTGTNE